MVMELTWDFLTTFTITCGIYVYHWTVISLTFRIVRRQSRCYRRQRHRPWWSQHPIVSRSTRLATKSSIWRENINYLMKDHGCQWNLRRNFNSNFNYLVELWFTFAQLVLWTLPVESRINTRSIAVAQSIVPVGPTGLQSGHSETFYVWLI